MLVLVDENSGVWVGRVTYAVRSYHATTTCTLVGLHMLAWS